ncbi:hypothetical protein BMS3Bbin10_00911 [bacterium BMS3Bbin10]|nr:hypothetical protein BMS3Bbin10_00911 [bacterium BMS3Bbin10]
MAQRPFGGKHTEYKLSLVENYLDRYTTALKYQPFRLIYFDAFAGAGDIPQPKDVTQSLLPMGDYKPFIVGSARRALALIHPFDAYVFTDKKKANVDSLMKLREEYPELKDRIDVHRVDANTELQDFCARTNWRSCRAAVFLDPFGNNVAWETLEAIAATKAIDLWYLFPAGLGVHRQIGKDGTVHDTHEASLDRMLGTREWRDAFIDTNDVTDLFDVTQKQTSKVADPRSITEFMIGRMRQIFEGGVLDEWLPLGSNNVHMYSLIFAWANPGEKAKLASKLAKAILKSK